MYVGRIWKPNFMASFFQLLEQNLFNQLHRGLNHAVLGCRSNEHFVALEFCFQRQAASRRRVARVNVSPEALRSRPRSAPALSEAFVRQIEVDTGKAQAADRHIAI